MKLVIDWLSGQCPVQAEGTIDGEPFYFRARGESWRFDVISGHGYGDDVKWSTQYGYGDTPFAAGWMSHDEARQFIEQAAQEYVDCGNAPDDDGQPDEMTEWRDFDPDC